MRAYSFSDAAESGASMDRPGIQDLLRRVNRKNPEFDVIIVESIDRLSRTVADTASLCDDLDFAQVRLIAVSESIDTIDPNARMMLGIKATLAQQFLTELGNKTRRGQRGAAKKGQATGGLPHGYTSVPQRHEKGKSRQSVIEIDEKAAEVVRRIFKLWIDGHSYRSIATKLNEDGIRTPRGASKRNTRGWPASTVREILRNPMYIGERTWGVRNWRKVPKTKKRSYRQTPEEDVERIFHPELRIVDEKTWSAAQERIKAVANKYAPKDTPNRGKTPTRKTSYVLSGLLVCAHCGGNMAIVGGQNSRYYRCTNNFSRGTCPIKQSVRETQISHAILGVVRKQLSDAPALAYLAEMLKRNAKHAVTNGKEEASKLNREINKIEGRIENLVEAVASGALSGAPLKRLQEKLSEEETRKAALERKLLDISEASRAARSVPTKEELIARAKDLIEHLDDLLKKDPIRAREQLRHFIQDGQIKMHAKGEDGWVAEFRLYPALVLEKPTKANGLGLSSKAVYFVGCAGWI